MAVLTGIDEAGFGPILGPLVVSSVSFSLPREALKQDLWRILSRSTAPQRRHLAGRLLICDSKKAYSKSTGIKHLQRTVLACLKSLGATPETLADLLAALCPVSLARLHAYPWYENLSIPLLSKAPGDLNIASSVFADDTASNKIKLLQIQSDTLDVAHYNKMVAAVKNKARVLFTATAGLIKNAFDAHGRDDLQVVVDRQGGRTHYRDVLLRMFPDTELTILSETQQSSSYELRSRDKSMRIHFTVGADHRFLPVALASMASKYLRELLIARLNHYFRQFSAELKPTAGYWTDGLRFMKDIQDLPPDPRIDHSLLVRTR